MATDFVVRIKQRGFHLPLWAVIFVNMPRCTHGLPEVASSSYRAAEVSSSSIEGYSTALTRLRETCCATAILHLPATSSEVAGTDKRFVQRPDSAKRSCRHIPQAVISKATPGCQALFVCLVFLGCVECRLASAMAFVF